MKIPLCELWNNFLQPFVSQEVYEMVKLIPALCLAVLAFGPTRSLAGPPTPWSPQSSPGVYAIPACKCGCMETGECRCKNCCERTADPTWRPAQSVSAISATSANLVNYTYSTVCGPNGCQIVRVPVGATTSIPADSLTAGSPSAATPKHPFLHRLFHPFAKLRGARSGGGCCQ